MLPNLRGGVESGEVTGDGEAAMKVADAGGGSWRGDTGAAAGGGTVLEDRGATAGSSGSKKRGGEDCSGGGEAAMRL